MMSACQRPKTANQTRQLRWGGYKMPNAHIPFKAAKGARTLNLVLGKHLLCQLSYRRNAGVSYRAGQALQRLAVRPTNFPPAPGR